MRKLSTEEFVARAQQIHGETYDYSETVYVGGHSKLTVICRQHGAFDQMAYSHLSGNGCASCARDALHSRVRFSTEQFASEARKVHGDRYNYSKVDYKNNDSSVIIVCPEHGEFRQRPAGHLLGRGCPRCGRSVGHKKRKLSQSSWISKIRLTTDEFVERAKQVHNEKYDYSSVRYSTWGESVLIICEEHGAFHQRPANHLSGSGCPSCGSAARRSKRQSSVEKFVGRAALAHQGKYNYDSVVYKNARTPVTIACQVHGEFRQTPDNHLRGQGCPSCRESKGEAKIASALEKLGVKHSRQYRHHECRSIQPLPFDFAIFGGDSELRGLIEYQGEQHFVAVDVWGGGEGLKSTQQRDAVKLEFCERSGIPLLIISYEEHHIDEAVSKFVEACMETSNARSS